MALNTSRHDIVILRRENVAKLRLRGFTQREITAALPKLNPPIMNGDKPFNLATINTDLKALTADWRARAAEDIDTRKARQLAEIDEARRRAWADGDLANLARFIKLESDIFGTMAAVKIVEVPWQEEAKRLGIDAEAQTLADTLFSKAVAATPSPTRAQSTGGWVTGAGEAAAGDTGDD